MIQENQRAKERRQVSRHQNPTNLQPLHHQKEQGLRHSVPSGEDRLEAPKLVPEFSQVSEPVQWLQNRLLEPGEAVHWGQPEEAYTLQDTSSS